MGSTSVEQLQFDAKRFATATFYCVDNEWGFLALSTADLTIFLKNIIFISLKKI
jgi:hypothetical protein